MAAPGWFDDPSGNGGQRYWTARPGLTTRIQTRPRLWRRLPPIRPPCLLPMPNPRSHLPDYFGCRRSPVVPAQGFHHSDCGRSRANRHWNDRVGCRNRPSKDASAETPVQAYAATSETKTSPPAAASAMSTPALSAPASTAEVATTAPAPIVAAPVAPPEVVQAPVTTKAAPAPPRAVAAPTTAAAAAPIAAPPAAPAVTHYPNCAALNVDYPHGVGRTGAVDHVSGSSASVTNFKVDDAVPTQLTRPGRGWRRDRLREALDGPLQTHPV